jgi:Ca2+-binding RTX toxin-like protein
MTDLGGAPMAKITGTNGNDQYPHELEGTNKADQIYGLAGNDTLIGLDGDDVLIGGVGGDELFGSAGFDMASYAGSSRGVQVDLLTAYAFGGDATGDALYSIEGLVGSGKTDHLRGDDLRNDVQGAGGSDALYGRGGNDRISGGNGTDILIGGEGADELRGDGGMDFARYYESNAAVTIDLAKGTGLGGSAQGDRFVGIESIDGSNFADRLIGNGAANWLSGAGAADVLTGGGGADRFYLNYEESTAAAPDRVTDFSRAQGDKIVTGDANAGAPDFQAFKFIGTNEFTGVGQLRWFQSDGDTIIEGNTDTAAGAELRVVLDPLVNLQAADFIFGDVGFTPPIES